MKLFTQEIEEKLQAQYLRTKNEDVDDMESEVVCKIFHPFSNWTWYIINQDPDDHNYLWGIVDGDFLEIGSFSKSDLEGKIGGLPFERDLSFKPIKAEELFSKLAFKNKRS